MEALQYIYTSWKNGDSTEKGYMIYSRSEGISESECTAIKDAMQYLAPKELTLTPTPQEIADIFPYAFSYFVLPTGRGCVAQSTYLGKDYSGRYGNYIIHALIFDINDLPCRPAEFFAEPYIKTAMTQEELDAPSPVPPLPPLHISEYASVINDEQLNEFLFDKEDEFAQLISMILVSQDAGIPFYLNDSRENLVLWAAAVQRILPSRLAKKFTFNTYIGDHESMRSPRAREEGLNFHLIGVRPDANYFNYATECKSNRQIVMDFIGGHMTQGVTPNSYAHAMAASIAFSKVLQALLKNITKINGCEKQMIEILFATSDNQALFENILSVFMAALREPRQLEQLCVKYVEITESLTDRQLNRFEQLLLETPGAAPIATRLCARKIASSKNPEDEFWRFYDNQRSRISANSGFTIEPMILACINNVDAKIREDVAIDILRKINASVINDGETIMVLTNAVNDCSVKELSKMDSAFLQRVCQIRAKVDKSGLEKIKAVFIGEMLTANNAQRKRPVNLSGELAQTGISLKSVEKSDYEAYIKNYFDEYFVLLQASEDVPALMRIFYHGRYFSNFIDDYISVLKKKAKKETERWKRILAWTCVYLVTAERSDQAAEELYKPIVRYLRSLDEDRLLDVRQAVIQDVPSSRCDYLFDEVRRKEGFVEKLGGFFHKK